MIKKLKIFFLVLLGVFLVGCSQEKMSENFSKNLQNNSEKNIQTPQQIDFPLISLANLGDMWWQWEDFENYEHLEFFLKNAQGKFSSLIFSDNMENEEIYNEEQILKILDILVKNPQIFSDDFMIRGRISSSIWEKEKILQKIVNFPVKNLSIATYDSENQVVIFDENATNLLKNSSKNTIEFEFLCNFSENNEKKQIVYFQKKPKLFCFLMSDWWMNNLFRGLNFDYSEKKVENWAVVYQSRTQEVSKDFQFTINEEKIAHISDFENLDFSRFNGKINIKIEKYPREWLVILLDRLSHENFEKISLDFSFADFDHETMGLLSFLQTKKLNIYLGEAYRWRTPEFVIPYEIVEIFWKKFEAVNIESYGNSAGGIVVWLEDENREKKDMIDGRIFALEAYFEYSHQEDEKVKKKYEIFHE